jgi:hypothetical protein
VKRTWFIVVIALGLVAVVAATAAAKPVTPTAPIEHRLATTQPAESPTWIGITLVGGLVGVAIAGMLVTRRRRQPTGGKAAPVRLAQRPAAVRASAR